MQTRNIILLIIVLTIITLGAFGFMYFRQPKVETPVNEEDTNFIATLWPFGKSEVGVTDDPGIPAGSESENTEAESEVVEKKLKRVSIAPVAGYGVFMKERYGETEPETVPYVRYADKVSGNILQTFADSIDERRFSITVVPKIYEAFFGNGGESVIMRYLKEDGKTIEAFAGVLPKEVLGGDSAGENELIGTYLPDNILSLSVSPDYTKIFYILPVGEGVVGITADVSGENKNQVFDSPFREWIPDWANERMITLTTKPSARVAGYMYAIDPLTKDFYKIMSGTNGLTTLTNPLGKLILYADNTLSIKIFNRDTKETISLGIRTLPEKCTFDKSGSSLYCAVPESISGSSYPDSWYQGEVSFSDEIWKIDTVNGNGSLLASSQNSESGEEIDAINMKIDETGKYLFFMNKKDSSLWMLEL